MNDLEISIIIPVYNTRQILINRCIKSVLQQTFKNFEVIIIDDGSNEIVAKTLDDISNLSKRIRLIHKKNEGVSIARNLGIRLSKGKYVTFIDSDDYISPFYLEKLYSIMKKDKVDIVTSYIKFVYDSDFEFFNNKNFEYKIYETIDEKNILLKNVLVGVNTKPSKWGYLSGGPCALLVNKYFIENLLFPINIHLMEDVIWNYQLFNKANRVAVINETLYAYKQNDNSATHTWNLSIINERIKSLNFIWKVVDNSSFEEWFALRVLSSYIVSVKCCLKTKEIKSVNTRIRLAIECYENNEIWRILEKKHISKNWSIKNKIKLFMIKNKILPIVYYIWEVINTWKK
jgi:glycosyltransferase involved in cell wall biosynthesis